jgi:hypothetical protein
MYMMMITHPSNLMACAVLVACVLQAKDVLMAVYFAADHVVWAHQIGLLQDKRTGERAQKVSLYSWAMGSVATMVLEANTILAVSKLSSCLAGWQSVHATRCLGCAQVVVCTCCCLVPVDYVDKALTCSCALWQSVLLWSERACHLTCVRSRALCLHCPPSWCLRYCPCR